MAYNHDDTYKRAPSTRTARYSTMLNPAPPRASMSSDRNSLLSTSPNQQKRKSRKEGDRQSIMSSRVSVTSQTTHAMTRKTSRLSRRDRPPPPQEDIRYTSFTPAMTKEEDARSEILALKNKLRSGLNRIVKAFIPKIPKSSHSKSQSDSFSPNHSFESSTTSQYHRW